MSSINLGLFMHLDSDNLAMLKTVIGAEVVTLLNVYLDTAPDNLTKLLDAIEQRNFREIELQSHTLKGSAANVGAPDLAELCSRLNNDAKTQTITTMAAQAEAIKAEANIVADLMQNYITNFTD